MSQQATEEICCPRFDPAPWDEQELAWEHKLFVKDRVTSFLHIPLNFGAVMRRSFRAIEAAKVTPEPIVLADETSPWGADVYIAVPREIPGARMAGISGTFLSKVFEGSFRDMPQWIAAMQAFVAQKGTRLQKLYFYYTTCPKCAKKYGKNYVVLLAQV